MNKLLVSELRCVFLLAARVLIGFVAVSVRTDVTEECARKEWYS